MFGIWPYILLNGLDFLNRTINLIVDGMMFSIIHEDWVVALSSQLFLRSVFSEFTIVYVCKLNSDLVWWKAQL